MDMVDDQMRSADNTGLSMLQKLALSGVVLGIVLIYLRTRNSKVLSEKNLL